MFPRRLSVLAAVLALTAGLLPGLAGSAAASSPGSIQGQDGGWSGGTGAISSGVDQVVDQSGSHAHTGVGSWRVSNSTVNGGNNGAFSGWPFGPGLTVSAGQPSSSAGADQFNATLWFKSGSATADGSNIEVDLGTTAGDDRNTFLAITNKADGDGGLMLRASEPDGVTGNFLATQVIASAISRTAWHRLDIVAKFTNGNGNDTFAVSLDGVAVANPLGGMTFGTFEGYRNGNAFTYALSNRLYWRSGSGASGFGAFTDTAAAGFYFDDLSYSAVKQSAPSTVLAGYTDGFEPDCTTICYADANFGTDANAGDASSPKKTIQAAVNQVTSGGQVIVAAGSYGAETISADKVVTINGAKVGIDGSTAGRPGTSATESVVKLDVTAGKVTLDGFLFDAAGSGHGVLADYASAGTNNGLTVRNSVLENGYFGLEVDGSSLLKSMLAERNLFLNNNTDPNSGHIWAVSPDTTIKTVKDNKFSGNLNADINLNWGAVTVSGNQAVNEATLLVVIEADPVDVLNNTGTFNGAGSAIFIGKGNHHVTVSGNSLTGAFRGVRFSNAFGGSNGGATTGAVVTGNTVTGALDSSIRVGAGSYSGAIAIDHNVVAGSTTPAVVFEAGSGVTAAGSTVIRNNLSGASAGLAWPDTGTLDGTCNWWGAANGPSGDGPGSGTSVTGLVTFSPWLTTSNLAGACTGVEDVTPPVIAPHGPVTADATGLGGASVTYTKPIATDAVDGTVPVTCVPASGSTFPLGTTTVSCDAVDAAGNHASQTHFTVTVSLPSPRPTTTAVKIKGPPTTDVGEGYLVTVSVTSTFGIPTGVVNVSDGTGGTCSGNLLLGFASCLMTSTTAGSKTITATYAGNATFASSHGTAKHGVDRAQTRTTITNAIALVVPSRVNQPYVVTWTVGVRFPGAGTPTGLVRVSDGSATCTASLAAGMCTLTSVSVGLRTVTVTYLGDANFDSSADRVSHRVIS